MKPQVKQWLDAFWEMHKEEIHQMVLEEIMNDGLEPTKKIILKTGIRWNEDAECDRS